MPSRKIKPRKSGGSLTGLTDRQRVFVEEYLADNSMNGSKAASKAGYSSGNAAFKLLNTKAVADAIGRAIQKRIDRCQLTADDVLHHLANVLFMDPLDLFESVGNGMFRVRSLDTIPPDIRRCISKIKSKTRETRAGDVETYIEIELMSKDAALQLAMKHLGLATDGKIDVNHKIGGDVLSHLLDLVEGESNVVDTHFIEDKTNEQ